MPGPPNILFITSDQHRYDCLSIADHPTIQTPHLDQLAYEGTRFTSAYADCPICIPARCTMISGQMASTYGKPTFFARQPFPVKDEDTLMGRLTRAGYQTQAIGKMHFHPHRARYGFEHMLLDLDYIDWLEHETPYGGQGAFLQHGMGLNEFFPVQSPIPVTHTSTRWFTDKAIEFLNKRDDGHPFFLWLSYYKPHPPIDPPEPYYSMYDNYPIDQPVVGDWTRGEQCPPFVRDVRLANKVDRIPPHVWRKIRSSYYGLITEIDHQLGRLFGHLRFKQLLENTLIVYTSDHGEMLGDHNMLNKTCFYDPAARLPFIVRGPNSLQAERGIETDAPIMLADILPTLLEVAGVEPPSPIDGRSFLPLLAGAKSEPHSYVRGNVGNEQFMVTDGREKYIWYRNGGIEQLFDLQADPKETNNLSGDAAWQEKLALWRSRLIQHLTDEGNQACTEGHLTPQQHQQNSERQARARNPFGWSDGRPWT